MNSTLSIENIPLSELVSHGQNPRKHTKKQIRQIADSIKTFGFRRPVIVDADNRLICGHGRVSACKLLGIESVPAVRAGDLDDAKIRAFMIADNRLTEIAGWDDSLLAENFKILSDLELDFDIDVTGFDYGEIEKFLESVDERSSDEPSVPDIDSLPAVAKAGDFWQLDKHLIYCGDSLLRSSYHILLPGDHKAAIIFTDPPYNLSAKEIGKTCEASHGDFAMGSGEMSSPQF